MLTAKQLLGLDNSHLQRQGDLLLEGNALASLNRMQQRALADGIRLTVASAHRSFDSQLAIWNAKANGQRVLRDKQHQPIDYDSLSKSQLVDAILIWSALPGASRHHWGTDVDLFDSSAIARSELQMVAGEYQQGGPCFPLSEWLQQNAADFGFYRPYRSQSNGVQPEPWHYSYAPIATQCLNGCDLSALNKVIKDANITLQDEVLAKLEHIRKHYVLQVDQPPW
ncbi:M15 family metallopeptidase [Paraferrimonas haliotis]|uniref:Peptidase M15 n=1 Tax=Paraferrimonas haliotis TaxID=2013866 RepID=A0AA37TMQ4_9GAMM|nr:M15 family metallopeptidase [Paraferrimonas haliotis]GLS84292.1 peptidase M15 [Paraferrimonas haliotis]